jgi:hypothetical protein
MCGGLRRPHGASLRMGRRVVNDTAQPDPSGPGVWVCASCSRVERACRVGGCVWVPVWQVVPDPRRMRAVDRARLPNGVVWAQACRD